MVDGSALFVELAASLQLSACVISSPCLPVVRRAPIQFNSQGIGTAMKDIRELLKRKESELERLRAEVAALHVAIRLLADADDWAEHGSAAPIIGRAIASFKLWELG